jgi:hypothetical protein
MLDGRHADSARRRQRVITALDQAAAEGAEISASGIARAARVDRTFLYRHRDLLEKIHTLQAGPAPGDGTGPAVTRASLQADLLAAHERAIRLNTRVQHLEGACPRHSGTKHGASPDSAPQPISTPSTRRSPTLNSRSSTCGCNSKSAMKTSPPPVPPTANS